MTIDLNDPRILVEPITTESGLRETAKNSNLKTAIPLIQRYNISNDEAYDLLKENHQSKIRSNLGNPQIEHSLPAVRLQWPYVSHIPKILEAVTLKERSIRQSSRNKKQDHSIAQ